MSKKRKRKKSRLPKTRYAKDYAERDQWVEELGFESYKEYLQSNLWKDIRRRQLRKQPCCVACGKSAVTGHHVRYTKQNLSGQNRQCIVSICHKCHYAIEFDEDRKLTLKRAQAKFRKLVPRWNLTKSRFDGKTDNQRHREKVQRRPLKKPKCVCPECGAQAAAKLQTFCDFTTHVRIYCPKCGKFIRWNKVRKAA